VPYYPPATFQEGLQACWLLHIAMLLEDFEQGMSFGRLDQALTHLYEADLARGALTREQALELWVSFEAKTGETIPLYSNRMDVYFSGNAVGQSITVGGVDADGRDASNELSELVLEAFGQLGTREPALHVRVHDSDAETPAGQGGGGDAAHRRPSDADGRRDGDPQPAKHRHDAGTRPRLRHHRLRGTGQSGTHLQLRRRRAVQPAAVSGTGVEPGRKLPGRAAGPADAAAGRPARLSSDVLAAFRAQVAFQVGQMQRAINRLEETYRVHRPTPVNSIMTQGCLAKGKDVTWGGGLYDFTSVQAVGLADAGDSLYALNKLVFEDRRCSLPQLVEILKADFAGQEPLRVELSRRFPRFGNGDTAADAMTQRAADAFTDAVTPRRNTRGGQWIAGFYSMSCGVGFGKHTGALPNGRKAGQRLSNGVSPSDGSDRKGPTAALRSVAGLDKSQWANAHVLNIKFDKKLVHGDTGIRNLGTLFRDYLVRQDGMQVQVNVQDAEILRAAKLNPEAYPDLLVRVSGYCSYFSDLRPEVQDEIIERMSHGL
jgi:pyruvate-formate lyase